MNASYKRNRQKHDIYYSAKLRFLGALAPKNRGVDVSNTLFFWPRVKIMYTATVYVPPLNFGKYSPCDFLSSFVALSVENTASATHATSTITTLLLWMRKNRGKKFCLIFSFVFAFWTQKCDECSASEFSFQKQHLQAKESPLKFAFPFLYWCFPFRLSLPVLYLL